MKKLAVRSALSALLVALLCGGLLAGSERKISRVYGPKERIVLETVSGDCVIKGGSEEEIAVEVLYDYSPDNFGAFCREKDNTLILKEKFFGSCSGRSRWTVTVPEGTAIEVTTTSGDIMVRDCTGECVLYTASGKVMVERVTGTVRLPSQKPGQSDGNHKITLMP